MVTALWIGGRRFFVHGLTVAKAIDAAAWLFDESARWPHGSGRPFSAWPLHFFMDALQTQSWNRQLAAAVVAVLICFAAAAIGGLVTAPQISGWYGGLSKPAWTPPDWVFGPVWTLLYLLMAISAWLVWRQAGFAGAKLPLSLFAIQLGLNSLWSVLFFGLQDPGAASIEIVLLWAAIVATLVSFWGRSRWAGALLVPYMIWVSFAMILNIAIWKMNI